MFSISKLLNDRPGRVLAIICLLQALLWTLVPALTHRAPPLDVVESYLWGREWVWATFKHPSFPGWSLEASRILTGQTGWPAYVLSQIVVVVTYVAVFRLGRDLFGRDAAGERLALGGVLLLTALYYMSLTTPEWNHNVPQIALYSLLIWAVWRATTLDSLVAWLWVGALGGLGLHVKYSFGILLVVAALWIVIDRRGRHLLRPGPWLGLLLFLVIASPQALWLVANDFRPFTYAQARAGGATTGNALDFLLAQIADHLLVFVLAAVAGLIARPRPRLATLPAIDRRLAFLLTFGLGPVFMAILLALVTGSGLKDMWGMPMFSLSGLLIVALAGERLTAPRLRRLTIGALIVVIALPLAYGTFIALDGRAAKKPQRVQWPMAAIAAQGARGWSQATPAPLKVVAGDVWVAGLVALNHPDHPSILTDGDMDLSPWVTPARLERQGALAVWQETGEGPPPKLAALIGTAPRRSAVIPWPGYPDRPPLVLGYAALPPR